MNKKLTKQKEEVPPISNVEYYAFADKVETFENGKIIIQFDCVDIEQIKDFSRDVLSSDEILSLATSMVECKYSENDFQKFQSIIGEELIESNWFILSLTDQPTQFPVSYIPEYESEAPPPVIRYISNEGCSKVEDEIQKKLEKIFGIQEHKEKFINWARTNNIGHILDQSQDADVSDFDVVVYNVGQGSMNAIVDNNGYPVAYFDVGGGAYWNAHTYPEQNLKNLCFKRNPIFVLSHWHYDHWWTFNILMRRNRIPRDLRTSWIVPDQKLGPFQSKFYHLLKVHNHNIYVWSDRSNYFLKFGSLAHADGKTKNDSGLILKVNIGSDSILLPGDASYEHILLSQDETFTGIVATHHGGNCSDDLNKFPRPRNEKGKIIYSYGLDNTYNHPSESSRNKHQKKGWTNEREAKNGTVSFTTEPDQIQLNRAADRFKMFIEDYYDIEQGFV